MRKPLLFAVAFVLAIATYVLAGSYTVTTTAAQDTKIGRMRTLWNTRNPGNTFGTDSAFVDFQCKDKLGDLFHILDATDDATFESAWDVASTATKNSVCTTLGLPAGCKP